MRLADELKLHTIAFPAISTGIFGYPIEQAAWWLFPLSSKACVRQDIWFWYFLVLFDKRTLIRSRRSPCTAEIRIWSSHTRSQSHTMPRTKVMAANWKMYKTPDQTRNFSVIFAARFRA